jgi:hypothetical protein
LRYFQLKSPWHAQLYDILKASDSCRRRIATSVPERLAMGERFAWNVLAFAPALLETLQSRGREICVEAIGSLSPPDHEIESFLG